MNKVKNYILLTAAILSVVLGPLVIIAVIADFAKWGFFEWDSQIVNPFFFVAGILLIVFGSLLCKKENRFKNILIVTAISIIGFMFILIIIGLALDGSEYIFYIFEIIMALGTLALFITGLCLKNSAGVNASFNTPSQKASSNEKIELLKKMRDEKQITEEEYKSLLMKELEK